MAEGFIGVVDSRTMGAGIALTFVLSGQRVIILDLNQECLDQELTEISRNLWRQVKN